MNTTRPGKILIQIEYTWYAYPGSMVEEGKRHADVILLQGVEKLFPWHYMEDEVDYL